MKRLFRAFARESAGATTIEYGTIAVLLALGTAVALEHKGDVLQERYAAVVAHFERVWGVEGKPATLVAEPQEFDIRRLPDLAPAGGADEK
jgi:Flp pilus assembly pilin Flp